MEEHNRPRIQKTFNLPMPAFGAVLGVAGLGLAWRKSAPIFGTPEWVGETWLYGAVALFAVLCIIYILKIVRAPHLALEEIRDNNRINFLAAVPLCVMMLSAGVLPYSTSIATLGWLTATIIQLVLVLIILPKSFRLTLADYQPSPSLLLPMAGLLIGPIIGTPIGYIKISWLVFVLGVALWLWVICLVLRRLASGAKPHPPEWPSYAIFIAPPALALLSYCALQPGGADAFTGLFLYMMLFFLLINLMLINVYRRLPYSLAWWAFTFPLAATSNATMQYHAISNGQFPASICGALLVIATGLVVYNLIQSVRGIRKGTLIPLHVHQLTQ